MLLSLQAVRAADRTGVCTRVMEIMAGLSPAGVHRELLYSAGQAGVLASGGRLVAADLVDRVLEWLSGRSLLTFSLDGQTVVMNRLVARVIRNGLARRGRLTAAYEAAAFVLDVYSRALVGSPDRRAVRGILQQVTALLDSLAGPATRSTKSWPGSCCGSGSSRSTTRLNWVTVRRWPSRSASRWPRTSGVCWVLIIPTP